jgi:hypothetical protein
MHVYVRNNGNNSEGCSFYSLYVYYSAAFTVSYILR